MTWEETYDYDDHDRVDYLVVVDTNYANVNRVKTNAKQIIKDFMKERSEINAIFHTITPNTSAIFNFSEDSDYQIFYWTVIAFDRNINIRIAIGSDEIGIFFNKNLSDIIPISLDFSSATKLDTSKFQGQLTARVTGKIKKPCKVVIFDSTDSRIICSETIHELAANDTFTFGGEWWTKNLGKHKISVIGDFENSIAERDEANNVLRKIFPTIPYGYVSVKDTIRLEELSYEHIELPTTPFIFFGKNSTKFSFNSKTNNEAAPDSLLKLFGERLKHDYPGLKITVRGYVDPASENPIVDQKRLSLLRAQKVKEKLIEYGARESQILIGQDHKDTEARVERTSAIIDPVDLEMVNEENRRAEIKLPDDLPAIKKIEYEKRFFAPRLIIRQKNEILSEKVKFNCLLHSTIPINNLMILVNDYSPDPFPIKVMLVNTILEDKMMRFTLDWDGIKDNGQMIAFNKTFYFTAFVVDTAGNELKMPFQDFYVGRNVIVKEKRIFALAKFNKVAPLHQFYLKQLDQVEDMMKKDNLLRIRFYGHTDVIGTEERNNILSADRAMELSSWLAKITDFDYQLADSTKMQLKSRIDNPFAVDSSNIGQKFMFGKGESAPLIAKNIKYGNNNTPQGRTLNRRVDIEIYRMDELKKPHLVIEKNITFHPWYGLIIDNSFAKKRLQKEKLGSAQINKEIFPEVKYSAEPILFASNESSNHFKEIFDSNSLRDIDSTVEVEIDPSLVNKVKCIELEDSLLWLGTENGLLKWDVSNDKFRIIEVDFWKYKRISAIKNDPHDACLWVGTHKGLRKLIKDDWIADYNVTTGLSGNKINCILLNKSGKLILGTNEGINIWDQNKWKVLANIDSGLTNDNVNEIYEDEDGSLWVCSNDGVYFKNSGGHWLPFEGNAFLPSDTVNYMLIDSNDNKWFGTAEGLYKFDAKNQPAKFATFNISDRIGIDNIFAIKKDKAGVLWCATNHGLSIYKYEMWYTYNYDDGLPANHVNAIILGNNNKKFVGFDGGGISILHLL